MSSEKAMLRDVEVDRYLKECVDLMPEAISEEFSRLSADYAYWNEKYADANREMLQAERHRDKTRAQAYFQKKAAYAQAGTKVTEATLDAEVEVDDLVEKAEVGVIASTAEREHLRGILEALRTKREMLVSVGAHMRAEMQGDPVTRERAQLHRAARED